MNFVHLHNHTQYSILDGACRIDKMVNLAKKMGMQAVAMTDHGNMYGTLDFCKTALKAEIKPIIGSEIYLVEHDYDHPNTKKDEKYHLILLVKNEIGYKNLCKLSSISYLQGFAGKPRVSKSLLKKYYEGLICLSACVQGEIPQKILNLSKEKAKDALLFYKNIFKDDFYIELQNHGLEDEKKTMPTLIELAKETNTEMVVTNDCHYLDKLDAEGHDVLLCIQTNKYVSDNNRLKYPHNMYFKTEDEMRLLFPELPEAADNTVKIADKIDFVLKYDNYLFPKIDIPKDFNSEVDYLRTLCFDAVPRRYDSLTDEIKNRINTEIDIITKMGFESYFLIVKDFIDAARKRGVPVGPGRGSAVGSIVAYLLGITQLCPLKYGLFFERFLNPERIEMPDIDIDFCARGRNEVIEYVIEKYGRNSVTQIITFGTLKPKSALKDVARVMEIQPQEANNLTKLIPSEPGKNYTLQDCFNNYNEFSSAIQNNSTYRKIFEISNVIEGLIRQIGVHAAGVVIGPGDLSDYVPLAISPQKEDSVLLVQYEGKWLEDLKMLKMDFLGLKTLTVMKKTIELISEAPSIVNCQLSTVNCQMSTVNCSGIIENFFSNNVTLDDKKTFALLSAGETDGVFQFESAGMRKCIKELRPTTFEDLIAMVALFRPGPMQFIDTFINRKHGREEVVFDHPLAANTLKETYGVTVYQEQVMQISRDMGGFSGSEADTLRKAMSKKNLSMMNKMKMKFFDGAMSRGVPEITLNKIWAGWEKFAEYAFNKSHAACYALLAYQTAYLKTHYPIEFLTATLSIEEEPEKIPLLIDVAQKMGIEILPPSINRSDKDFSIVGKKILFGLNAIKNVGSIAISSIITERETNGLFTDFFNFVTRFDTQVLNKSVLESLIMAGVLDDLPGNRASKFKAISHASAEASKIHESKKSGQFTFFDLMEPEEIIESSPQLPDIDEWDNKTLLENEKSVLGFYMTANPLDRIKFLMNVYANVNTREASFDNNQLPSKLKLFGKVTNVSNKVAKNGNNFTILTLEDYFGKFEVTLFANALQKFKQYAEHEKELFIIGNRSAYQGGNNDSMLKINPDRIMTVDELISKVKGDIIINLNETDITTEFGSFLCDFSERCPGKMRVVFRVKSIQFGDFTLMPNKMMINPNEEFVKEVKFNRNLLFDTNFEC